MDIRRVLQLPKKAIREVVCSPKTFLPKAKRWIISEAITSGPRTYDFYFHHFTSLQQGSINRSYPKPAWQKGARHVLIFTMRYWALHTAIEAMFAKERQRQGWNVTMVGCDDAISTCDNMMYDAGEPALSCACNYCSYLLRKLCKRTGIEYISIRKYLNRHQLRGKALSKERDYEKLVFASWVRLLRSLHPQKPQEFALRDSLITSCRMIDKFLTHYLENNRVDQVIMLNGKFFAEQLLSQHCREKKIPYITYERGIIKETLMFAEWKPAIPAATRQRWEQRKEIPLTNAQRRKLHAYLDSRKQVGNAEEVPFYTDITEDEVQLCREYHISTNKDLVVLFTNSVWDSTTVSEDTIFDNMFDWISFCIRYYQKQHDTQLVIRVHPVEAKARKKQQTRDRADNYILRQFGEVPNIKIIPPESETSPYTLMEMAALGLVYNSTTGLEMALRGKPVIVAANAHYANTEFVHTPQTRTQYLRLLKQPPPPLPDQISYAERYGYMFFFEHMVPYGDMIEQHDGDYKLVSDIRKSNILERAGL